jgi:DNA-damage-inducible protein J
MATVPVQTRVDAAVKEKAGAVLSRMGLTVSDAVRILLTRIAHEGALPPGLTTDAEAHDTWFRARVQEALDDPRPPIAHEEVEAVMAKARAKALQRFSGD